MSCKFFIWVTAQETISVQKVILDPLVKFKSILQCSYILLIIFREKHKPAWRNGLARWTSNPKVVGSNPTVGVLSVYMHLKMRKSGGEDTRK